MIGFRSLAINASLVIACVLAVEWRVRMRIDSYEARTENRECFYLEMQKSIEVLRVRIDETDDFLGIEHARKKGRWPKSKLENPQ